MKKLIVFFSLSFVALFGDYKVIGYYENWSQYRTGFEKGAFACFPNSFSTAYLTGLTHLNYAFAFFNYGSVNSGVDMVTNDWKIYPSEWDDIKSWETPQVTGLWHLATNLQGTIPGLKVMLSIGGWNFCTNGGGSYGSLTYTFFPQMVADMTKRTAFINSAVEICTNPDYPFAGIDIDWEFPASSSDHGGTAADYQNLLDFLAALKSALAAHGKLLTITVPPAVPSGLIAGSYTVGMVNYNVDPNTPATYFQWQKFCSDQVDWLNVMCYDYYGPGYSPTNNNHRGQAGAAPLTADNAPLYTFQTPLSVEQTISYYLNAGISGAKIVIGLPAYGHTYMGVQYPSTWDPTQQPNGPGCPYTGADSAGGLTGAPGFLSYIEIYQNLQGSSSQSSPSLNQSNLAVSSLNSRPFACCMLPTETLAFNLNSSSYYTGAIFNSDTGTYYAYNLNTGKWVSFDTPNGAPFNTNGQSSIALKCEYIKSQNLGGALIWALDDDYFTAPVSSTILQTAISTLNP